MHTGFPFLVSRFPALSRFSFLVSLFSPLAASACAQSSPSWYLRPTPVEGLPDRIEPDTARGAPAEVPDSGCISPLLDPGSGTRFLMIRSVMLDHGPIGDYTVEPANAWGIDPKSVIRVDCAIGRPLGAVPR